MRAQQTEEERTIEPALFDYLRGAYKVVNRLNRERNDSPDFAYVVNESVIGIEAVQIPPASVVKAAHSKEHERFLSAKDKLGEPAIFSYVWPDEPHSWIARAISEKQKKLSTYARNLGTDRISLLVHTPVELSPIFDPEKHKYEMTSLRYGEQISRHSFNEVLFWHPIRGVEVVAPTISSKISLNYHLMDSYPVGHHTITSTGVFSAGKDVSDGTVFHDEVVSPHVQLIKPIDPHLRRMKPDLKEVRIRIRTIKVDGQIRVETTRVMDN